MKYELTYNEIYEMKKMGESIIFVDMRSPSEFAENKIPGAINLPILDDDERKVVGTCYVKESVEKAKYLGINCAKDKLPRYYKKVLDLTKNYDHVIIYCSRGGYRSTVFFTFLRTLNVEVKKLLGGYKSYRKFISCHLDNLISEMKKIENVNWESCVITKNDSNFKNTKEALEGIQKIVSTAIIVIFIISIILIVLILNLWTKHRINEIAILLSVGISKKDIIWQQIIEILMVSVPAFILSFLTSSIATKIVGSKLISSITNSIEISVNIFDWLLISGIGLVIVLTATILSIYQITKIKPRDIFSKID